MTPRSWKNIGAWTLAAVLSLAGLLWLAEYLDRGAVMRPVRKMAEKMGIEIPRPEITPSEEIEARAMAKDWKQECLDKFPELRVNPRPLPDAENGFWLLSELHKQAPLSKEFAKLLDGVKTGYPPDAAARLLSEHPSQVGHIEHIADLSGRSNMDLSGYDGFLRALPIKQAMEILLLKACLAADARNEAEALCFVRRSGKIIAHLRDVETPNLMSETLVVLGHQAMQEVVMKGILPKLGPECDLQTWKELTSGADLGTPSRFAQVLRGEWQVGADHFAFFAVASEDKLGLLADGKGCAIAYSAWMAGIIQECEPAKGWNQVHQSDHQNAILKLPREQAGFMSLATMGLWEWKNGFERAWLANAQHQAALELLMLEKAGKPLTADSVRDISHDPLSGDPFIFDPVKRTLEVPAISNKHGWQPLKLPW